MSIQNGIQKKNQREISINRKLEISGAEDYGSKIIRFQRTDADGYFWLPAEMSGNRRDRSMQTR